MSEWKEYKLEDITTRIGDGLHGTPKYDDKGTFFFINGNNINNGKITIKQDTKKISEEEYLKYSKPLGRNTILMSINGTIGNVAKYNGEKCMLGKSACYINLIDGISRDFIYYIFISRDFQDFVENIATGTTIPNVPLKGLREYLITLPPLADQENIASILSSLDDKIDLLNRQNRTLESMAETLFRRYFIDEAQEEWKEGILDDILSVKGGATPSTANPDFWNGAICWTSPRDVTTLKGIYMFRTDRKITEKGLSQISSGLLPKGTLLMSSRAPVGVLAFAEVELAINQGYIAILDNKGYSKEFIYLWLKTNMDSVHSFSNGSTFMEISKSAFKSLPLTIPPIDLAESFQLRIKPIFERIKYNQIQTYTLTNLRDTLLPKLMNGEVELKKKIR